MPLPRVVIAGLGGDTGKTLVSSGLTRALTRRGLRVAPFKKGPDYIDAAWLGAAAGRPGRNLDTFMMPRRGHPFVPRAAAESADVAVIEGNRGLFDGLDSAGSHSTAELAKLVGAPVILVVDAAKVTRTVAALVLGCQALDPDLRPARRDPQPGRDGAAGEGHPRGDRRGDGVARPRLDPPRARRRPAQSPPRAGHGGGAPAGRRDARPCRRADGAVPRHRRDPRPGGPGVAATATECLARRPVAAERRRVRVGVPRDAAFSFYYPENLEALEHAGAELVRFSPISDPELPEVDALVVGGGFPEVYAAELSANRPMREDCGEADRAGPARVGRMRWPDVPGARTLVVAPSRTRWSARCRSMSNRRRGRKGTATWRRGSMARIRSCRGVPSSAVTSSTIRRFELVRALCGRSWRWTGVSVWGRGETGFSWVVWWRATRTCTRWARQSGRRRWCVRLAGVGGEHAGAGGGDRPPAPLR